MKLIKNDFQNSLARYGVKLDTIEYSSQATYECIIHEIIHATGAAKRLNRNSLLSYKKNPICVIIEELTAYTAAIRFLGKKEKSPLNQKFIKWIVKAANELEDDTLRYTIKKIAKEQAIEALTYLKEKG